MTETETATSTPPTTPKECSRTTAQERIDKLASLRRNRRHHLAWLIVSIVVLVLALWLEVHGGTDVVIPKLNISLPQTCMMRRLSGLNCPGCGLTRSFIAIGSGDIAQAWNYNAAGWLVFALVIVQPPFRTFQLRRLSKGRDAWNPPWFRGVAWILLGALLTQWLWQLVERGVAG